MKTIGLVMIVRNEASIILRCLRSVRPLLDYVSIIDTGSTDDTIATINAFLAEEGLPGQVLQRPWRDFATNRIESVAALREIDWIDYAFTIDADEVLQIDSGLDIDRFKARLTADLYHFEIVESALRYRRAMLFSNRKPFAYRGVLHEFLQQPPDTTALDGTELQVRREFADGARSRNPNKYADDAKVLENALLTETDPQMVRRYTFYLAQSYRDARDPQRAHDMFLKRAGQDGWDEEVHISLLRAAQMSELLGHTPDQQIAAYLRAYEHAPKRAEGLHGAARVCRIHKRYQTGTMLARQGVTLVSPAQGLFIDQTVYDYALLDELQINSYWAGNYSESLDAAERLLREKRYPIAEHRRIADNAEFARRKIAEMTPSET